MPHCITYTEEIEEHGNCQQQPALTTGEKYLHEVDGQKRLRIVKSVHFDKYVWENVAQWTTVIEEYDEKEYKMRILPINIGTPSYSEVPVFIAQSLIGVLTCDKEKVEGELFIPSHIGIWAIRGVAPYGFYDCQRLKTVVIDSPVAIAYEYAFAKSGITDVTFNEEVPVMLHITALDDCENLPKFDKLFDKPFKGKYLMRGGDAFREWEDEVHRQFF